MLRICGNISGTQKTILGRNASIMIALQNLPQTVEQDIKIDTAREYGNCLNQYISYLIHSL